MGLVLPRLFRSRQRSLLTLDSRLLPIAGLGVSSVDWSLRLCSSLFGLWLVRDPSPSDCLA